MSENEVTNQASDRLTLEQVKAALAFLFDVSGPPKPPSERENLAWRKLYRIEETRDR